MEAYRYEHRGRHHRSPYFVSENKVYYDGREIEGASASSLSILRSGYAKDTWNVYYCGVKWMGRQATHSRYWAMAMRKTRGTSILTVAKIEGASSDSFNILSDWYAKDTWNVYFDGKKINGASPDSFKVLRDGYAKDRWNVYFDSIKIEGASPDNFNVLHDGYAKDTWNTYYFGRKID